jgi:hypothetical protein
MGEKIEEVSWMIMIRNRDAWHITEGFHGNAVPTRPVCCLGGPTDPKNYKLGTLPGSTLDDQDFHGRDCTGC